MTDLRTTLNVDSAPVADPGIVPAMHRHSDSVADRINAPRFLMRAKSRMRRTVINGTTLRPDNATTKERPYPGGTVEFYIYDTPSDWKGLASKYETEPALVAAAERQHLMDLRKYIADKSTDVPDVEKGRVEFIPEDPSKWTDAMVKASNKCPSSLEAAFQKLTQRSIRPLTDLEIVLRDVPPPMSVVQSHSHGQTKMLADALKSAGVGGTAGGVPEEKVAEMIEAAVKKALAESRGNGGGKGRR